MPGIGLRTNCRLPGERTGLDSTGSGVYLTQSFAAMGEWGLAPAIRGASFAGEGLRHLSEKGQGPAKGFCVLLLSPSPYPVRDGLGKGPSLSDGASVALAGYRQYWPFLEDLECPLSCRQDITLIQSLTRGSEVEFLQVSGEIWFTQPNSSFWGTKF